MPGRIQDKLVDTPKQDLKGLGVNNRIRRRWQREGVTIHLYTGKKEGYYLQRAVEEMGGDLTRVFKVDTLRNISHDMMADDGVYSCLLRMAMDGVVDGIIGGPNCRETSTI